MRGPDRATFTDRLAPLAGLVETINTRLGPEYHGDAARWRAALDSLPAAIPSVVNLGDTITIGSPADLTSEQHDVLLHALQALRPWRKGPFSYFGHVIDTEWRSDWKWQRLCNALGSLSEQSVLDVGAGNGYYGWRMLQAGAAQVVAIDPTIVFNMQFLAAHRYLRETAPNHWLLPLRLEELPAGLSFDVAFSMGVIYHRRDPAEHLSRLRALLSPGGRLVLETLIVDDASGPVLTPRGRYARMRNVHALPSLNTLCDWLRAAGFEDLQTVDVTPTTVEEQRTTPWMTFESLAESLDPDNSSRTIEGYPAPVRAIVMARRDQAS